MPFDSVNFTLPTIETDEVLRMLTDGRARIAKGWTRHMLHRRDLDGDGYCARGALCPELNEAAWITSSHWSDTADGQKVLVFRTHHPREDNYALVLAEGYLFDAIDKEMVRNTRVVGFFASAGCLLACYNNMASTTHADIVSLFDRAIAARRATLLTMAEAA